MFGWIVLGVVILIAVISAVSQMVKSQEESNPKRPRPGRSGDKARSSSGDIDRFLQEIDRLRNKGAAPAEKPRAVAKPVRQAVPVVEPARRTRVDPDAPDRPVPTSSPRRVDDLPVAAVATPAARPAKSAPAQPQTIAGLGRVATRSPQPVARTEGGRQLLALLRNPQALPVAVIMHEILGPPKCKQ